MNIGVDAMVSEAAAYTLRLTPSPNKATVVTLAGGLGAGKTTFVQGMAKALGIEESVTSPTFVIEKIYQLKDKPFEHLIHIDAYRLKGAQELEVLGWNELIVDSKNLIVIEWPEKVAGAIPKDARTITFEIAGDSRNILYDR